MISGLSHMTFVVKDLDAATKFWVDIFDAKEVYASGDKTFSEAREKFFLVGDIWVCIMEGTPLTKRTYNHIAFRVSDDDFDSYVQRIKDAGAEIKTGRPRVEGEGRSVYFYDFDNHLFELHTGGLKERLMRYDAPVDM